MTDSVRAAVERHTAQIRALSIDLAETEWVAATTGTPQALNAAAEAQRAWMRFRADADAYAQYRQWDEEGQAEDDAHLVRMVRVLHFGFGAGQHDPATIDEMSDLTRALNDAYTNFRAEVNGQRLTANAISEVLRGEDDSQVRRGAWEASKQIGPRVAGPVRRLAELRNMAAQRMGFANFHRMSLAFDELDADWLYAMLDELAVKTEAPYRSAKAELDAELSARFGVPAADLMPWHYADPFAQSAPILTDYDFDALFAGRELEPLSVATYDGLGMDVRDILGRSDLYEREGKDQHAFCTDIDREGDVRILCNLRPNLRWMDTLLHELGHAVYNKYIPTNLPWLLRTISHILTTEAMALLMGTATLDPEWHERVLGVDAIEAARAGAAGYRRLRLQELIFARWVLVVVHFERALYEDPSRDLDALWWELVQRYQLLNKPDGREKLPDWATKYHIALVPAYYQNYLLGRMMSLQWEDWLRRHAGGIIGRREAGEFFCERVFAVGNTMPWDDGLEHATGERLNPDHFVEKFARP
jgi:peptidyl-dipeptidase A